ncbi:hypothetical protein PLESTF_001819600 [Pleodorina starrii]|nr:hypothetical protein PLESTF_001819600 [Pleodorina starrii]
MAGQLRSPAAALMQPAPPAARSGARSRLSMIPGPPVGNPMQGGAVAAAPAAPSLRPVQQPEQHAAYPARSALMPPLPEAAADGDVEGEPSAVDLQQAANSGSNSNSSSGSGSSSGKLEVGGRPAAPPISLPSGFALHDVDRLSWQQHEEATSPPPISISPVGLRSGPSLPSYQPIDLSAPVSPSSDLPAPPLYPSISPHRPGAASRVLTGPEGDNVDVEETTVQHERMRPPVVWNTHVFAQPAPLAPLPSAQALSVDGGGGGGGGAPLLGLPAHQATSFLAAAAAAAAAADVPEELTSRLGVSAEVTSPLAPRTGGLRRGPSRPSLPSPFRSVEQPSPISTASPSLPDDIRPSPFDNPRWVLDNVILPQLYSPASVSFGPLLPHGAVDGSGGWGSGLRVAAADRGAAAAGPRSGPTTVERDPGAGATGQQSTRSHGASGSAGASVVISEAALHQPLATDSAAGAAAVEAERVSSSMGGSGGSSEAADSNSSRTSTTRGSVADLGSGLLIRIDAAAAAARGAASRYSGDSPVSQTASPYAGREAAAAAAAAAPPPSPIARVNARRVLENEFGFEEDGDDGKIVWRTSAVGLLQDDDSDDDGETCLQVSPVHPVSVADVVRGRRIPPNSPPLHQSQSLEGVSEEVRAARRFWAALNGSAPAVAAAGGRRQTVAVSTTRAGGWTISRSSIGPASSAGGAPPPQPGNSSGSTSPVPKPLNTVSVGPRIRPSAIGSPSEPKLHIKPALDVAPAGAARRGGGSPGGSRLRGSSIVSSLHASWGNPTASAAAIRAANAAAPRASFAGILVSKLGRSLNLGPGASGSSSSAASSRSSSPGGAPSQAGGGLRGARASGLGQWSQVYDTPAGVVYQRFRDRHSTSTVGGGGEAGAAAGGEATGITRGAAGGLSRVDEAGPQPDTTPQQQQQQQRDRGGFDWSAGIGGKRYTRMGVVELVPRAGAAAPPLDGEGESSGGP